MTGGSARGRQAWRRRAQALAAALIALAALPGAVSPSAGWPLPATARPGAAGEWRGAPDRLPSPIFTAAAAARPREYRSLRTVGDPGDVAGPLDVVRATVGQAGRDLVMVLSTDRAWTERDLAADPRRAACLFLWRQSGAAAPDLRLCLLPRRRVRGFRLSMASLAPSGLVVAARLLGVRVIRPDRRSASVRVRLDAVALRPGSYRWQARTAWFDATACATGCIDAAPGPAPVAGRVVAVRPVGCTGPRRGYVSQGSRALRVVALTFDDGPSRYTLRLLRILERERVHATFFVLGQQVRSGRALVRRALGDGDILANHTWSHPVVAGGGPFALHQLAPTSAVIRRTTGFQPCLFRPPYGAVSRRLVADARGLGLTTIGWDVDPRDWSRPGTSAIIARVTQHTRPGSIILMHDGGGPRRETLAAVPVIIHRLRTRGYRFALLNEILDAPMIYGRATRR